METGNENLITDNLEILAGLPLLTGCEIPGLFRTFSSKFEDLLYQKSFVILYIYSAMSCYKTCFWGNIGPPIWFSYILTSKD